MKRFWRSARRWLPGVIISLAAVSAILYWVDLEEFGQAVRAAEWRFLLAGVLVSIAWVFVRGAVWRALLQNKASYKHAFLTVCEGYLLNNFFPFRLGEVGRAFLLSRKTGLGFMEVLSTIVIERLLDLAFSAAVLLVGVSVVVQAAGAEKVGFLIGGLMVLGLAILYLLARNRAWAMGQFERLSTRWPVLQRLDGFLDSLFAGLGALTDGWLFLRVLALMAVNWSMAVLQFYFFVRAFFPPAQWTWAVFGLGATAFGNAIPSLPGAVGTYEGAFAGALTLLSGDEATALAVALTAHLIAYLVNGILGVYAFSTEGETLMGVYRQLRRRQEEKEQA
ncbi:MAG: flippase-like domain-containing protein [Anaerolineales bacterium]|nr:flippase-like domain-containing protein [Anaerolineales bacterium]